MPNGKTEGSGGLEGFGEFFGEGAARAVIAVALAAALFAAPGRTLLGRRRLGGRWLIQLTVSLIYMTDVTGGLIHVVSGVTGVTGARSRRRACVPGRTMTGVSGRTTPGYSVTLTGMARTRGADLTFRFGRLRRIGAEQAVFERSAVEAADDGVHFIDIRRFDKREALGLLRFRIANDLNCVRDQVLG